MKVFKHYKHGSKRGGQRYNLRKVRKGMGVIYDDEAEEIRGLLKNAYDEEKEAEGKKNWTAQARAQGKRLGISRTLLALGFRSSKAMDEGHVEPWLSTAKIKKKPQGKRFY